MKEIIAKLLAKAVKLKEKEIQELIEIPSSSELGDYAFPCFKLSSLLKKNPAEIAKELEKKIPCSEKIEKIEAKGSYVNFFINKKLLVSEIIEKILKQKQDFGKG